MVSKFEVVDQTFPPTAAEAQAHPRKGSQLTHVNPLVVLGYPQNSGHTFLKESSLIQWHVFPHLPRVCPLDGAGGELVGRS